MPNNKTPPLIQATPNQANGVKSSPMNAKDVSATNMGAVPRIKGYVSPSSP
jgi:hypothetical protein